MRFMLRAAFDPGCYRCLETELKHEIPQSPYGSLRASAPVAKGRAKAGREKAKARGSAGAAQAPDGGRAKAGRVKTKARGSAGASPKPNAGRAKAGGGKAKARKNTGGGSSHDRQ